jgi:cobalt-zinc-cadmium efflux system outer membrane protein
VDLAEQLVQTAERRVKSGGASVLEQAKAEIERASAIANQEQMERHLEASRRQLATLVGVPIATIAPARGDLYHLHELPVFEELEQRLPANPDWARWPAEIEQREAATALANTLRVPDLDLGVGWRRDEDADAHSFIFSAGIPLPIFDRGQGSRQAAHHEQAAAQEERRVAELALERELAGAYGELAEAHARATAIKERILPAANKAFDLSREGYLQGRFGYIDLLDAQRTLFDTRSEYVEVLRIYHQALAVVARLTAGGPDFSQLNTEE